MPANMTKMSSWQVATLRGRSATLCNRLHKVRVTTGHRPIPLRSIDRTLTVMVHPIKVINQSSWILIVGRQKASFVTFRPNCPPAPLATLSPQVQNSFIYYYSNFSLPTHKEAVP